MAINFPNNPTPNQKFEVGNRGWRWNADLGVWESFLAAPALVASNIDFDNENTILVSNTVQEAIEEVTLLTPPIPPIATQEEAEEGIDNEKFMTPLRTAQAIATIGPVAGTDTIFDGGFAAIVFGAEDRIIDGGEA